MPAETPSTDLVVEKYPCTYLYEQSFSIIIGPCWSLKPNATIYRNKFCLRGLTVALVVSELFKFEIKFPARI